MIHEWDWTKPVHLVDEPGDKHTLCGRKTEDGAVCWRRFARAHRYSHPRCRPCYAAVGLAILLDADMVDPT